jgi:hypothetical protein
MRRPAERHSASPRQDPLVEQPAVLGSYRRREVGRGVHLPAIAKLGDRADLDDVLTFVDLAEQPT